MAPTVTFTLPLKLSTLTLIILWSLSNPPTEVNTATQKIYKQEMCFHTRMNNEAVARELWGVNSLAVEVNRGRGPTPLS